MTMSDDCLPAAPVNDDADADVPVPGSTTSSVAETHDIVTCPAEETSRGVVTSVEVSGGVDSDSGGSLSSSASPAPPPGTVTHDEWNANEPSDGTDSGVGANGSTPVDGDSLCLSFDGPVTTGSPAYMLTPPFVPQQYPAMPQTVHPSCVTIAPDVGTDGPPPVMHSPIISHIPVSEDHLDGSTTSIMSCGSAEAGPNQQYVVNVHVNAGETFSVRAGDRVQLIHGNYPIYCR